MKKGASKARTNSPFISVWVASRWDGGGTASRRNNRSRINVIVFARADSEHPFRYIFLGGGVVGGEDNYHANLSFRLY